MRLINPNIKPYSRRAYSLLVEILKAPGCPWAHRVASYEEDQTQLLYKTLVHIDSLLQGTFSLDGRINRALLPEEISAVFTRASSRTKTILSFLYDEYSRTSPFAHHFVAMQKADSVSICRQAGYDSILRTYGLDPEYTVNADGLLALISWFNANESILRYANYGSWDWCSVHDVMSFVSEYMRILNANSNLYGNLLQPDSYGMAIVDRALRKKGIKIQLTEIETSHALAMKEGVAREKHSSESIPFDPSIIGDMEKEMAFRAERIKG